MLLRRNRMLMGLRCIRMERMGLLVLQSLHCGSGAILLFLNVSEAAGQRGGEAARPRAKYVVAIHLNAEEDEIFRISGGRGEEDDGWYKEGVRTVRFKPISRMTQFVMRVILIPNSRNR